MDVGRLPWEIIETFPSTDSDLLAHWSRSVATASDDTDRARAMIGHGLALYWATQEGLIDEPWSNVARARTAALGSALELARHVGDTTLIAEALLGVLYGTWGPDSHLDRAPLVEELTRLRPGIDDEEIRLRSIEWEVLQHLDAAELDAARRSIDEFTQAARGTELIVFTRREVLWRGCLAMLDGHLDEALAINQEAISSTANVAGSPFSFQNVAITLAIERFLRRGLGDVVDALRSIRASSPRVGANWDTGLAFALSEIGELDEAAQLFEQLAVDRFAPVPRDLNWLVTMQLLGLIALTIDADTHGPTLIELLRPFAHLDGTHGSGYASYGPVGRVVGSLMARWGDPDEAELVFEQVLSTRAPGPWTALTWFDRAVARRNHSPADSYADARRAEEELARYGLDGWAAEAQRLADQLASVGHRGPVAILRDGTWTLRHDAGTASIAPSIGVEHLVALLGRAGDSVDVADMGTTDPTLERSASAESSLDSTARGQYRRRLDALEGRADPDDDERLEIEFLRRELSGSSYVVSNSAELERLRVRVSKAIHRTLEQIATVSPDLGAHLRSSVATGRTCIYQPPDGESWLVLRRQHS